MKPVTLRASTFERRLCPGSVQAESGLPDLPDEGGVAESGKKIHNALRMYFSRTVEDVNDIAVVCELNERETIVTKWFVSRAEVILIKHGGMLKYYPELKLDETDDGISGTADFVALCNDGTWQLFDWKSGWGRQITAELNLQLRVYALKVAEKFGCLEIDAHLFAAGNDPADSAFSSCHYGPDEITESRKEIYAIRDACFMPKAPRLPLPDRCKYCKANGNPERCKESFKTPKAFTAIQKRITPAMSLRLKKMYVAFKLAEKAQQGFKQWLKEAMRNQPEAIPWATFSKPKERRVITDADRAFSIGIAEQWFTQEEFVRECVNIKIPSIEKLAKRIKKQDEVEEKLTEAGVLKSEAMQPSIELVKED